MASPLHLAHSIQLNGYASLVVITAVIYDFIITFSNEVEYIWTKPWTRVSTLFVLARYFGLCCVLTFTLVGTPLVPGPEQTYVFRLVTFYGGQRYLQEIDDVWVAEYFLGNILLFIGVWSLMIFIAAADLVMILRVWALYSRSTLILGLLLTFYTVDIILYLVDCFILTIQDKNKLIGGVAQVFNFSLCVLQPGSPVLTEAIDGLQMTLGALMCLLVVIRFIKESFQMYKITKRFQPSRYMNLFVREGVIYFLAILTYALLNTLVTAANIPLSGWWILLLILQFIPAFTLVPRFILSLRELYAQDLRGRRGNELDTAFGLRSVSAYGNDAAMNTIRFADGEQEEGFEQEEGETPIEERARGSTSHGV